MLPLDTAGTAADAAHLVRACVALFGLGIVMGFSPTTVGIQIEALRRSTGAPRRVAVIVAAVAAAATLLGLVFIVISPNTLHALWTGRVRTLLEQRWLDALIGLLLIIVGVLRWRRARSPRRTAAPDRLDRPRVLGTVTFVNSLISTTGPATMYLVIRTIGTTRPVLWPVEYLIFLAGLAAPYVVLAIALIRIPGVENRLSDWLADLAKRDLRRPIAVLIMVVGLALVVWAAIEVARAG